MAEDQNDVSILVRPRDGETRSGDAAAAWSDSAVRLFCVADGLGHGPEAAHAAQMAMKAVEGIRKMSLQEILEQVNQCLHGTRGAAVGLARLRFRKGRRDVELECAAVGNTSLLVWRGNGDVVRTLSSWGILGTEMPRLHQTSLTLLPQDRILMFTDGISRKIQLNAWQGSRLTPDALLAEIEARWGRREDDAALLYYRIAAV